ncbi:tyrosine-type recombinase/integrase [Aminipila butyrica]|uniref:Tyrosine-type recombinase/integrase n=1 Tax=Aminipila butyrica TaxID=433296 RepID=A0A858BTX5_9FIRM|nr:tyrosine-type recombinase/integrase [Aminipila butyrica]QIB68224.1 tyrosine-type recombinase/integrase [Aminipila butyrica]
MANAKRLPSGAWRTLVFSHTAKVDGKDKRVYESFTSWDKDESEFLAAEFKLTHKKKKSNNNDLTVSETIDKYLTMRELLSPTTIEGYRKIKKYAFQNIMNVKVKNLDNENMQIAINDEAKRISLKGTVISPKTVANEYGLLSTAIHKIHALRFDIVLPKRPIKNVELPEPQEVIRVIKGTWVELPCMLAIWLSFSMSEIRGLKCSSVKNGTIYIDQVLVDVENKSYEKSTGKAERRIRKHQLPAYITDLIARQESYIDYKKTGKDRHLVPLTRNQIYGRFKTIMENANFDISFHDLRHLNASVMLMLNIPEKYAMERGGWKTPHTMKKVYQHTFSTERKIVDKKIDEYFDKLL